MTGNQPFICEGEMVHISLQAVNFSPGDNIEFYLGTGAFNPYDGEGDLIGSVAALGLVDFDWMIPFNFCTTYGEGDWSIVGILSPAPGAGCSQIFTPYFDLPVSCPELMMSGGGYVCEGNCPDAPNEIVFFVVGNDLPFTADIEITASVFPPFLIEDLSIQNGQQLFICLGGVIPSFDPVTNTLTVPSFAVGITATLEIITLTSASGCPVLADPSSITISFIAAPTANAGPDQTICSFETVSLNGSLGGSATNAMWTSGGDGVFADPNALNTTYTPGSGDLAAGMVALTLTGTDGNAACIPAESSLLVTIDSSLIIVTGPDLTVCNTDDAMITAIISGPDAPGVWESDGDGSFEDPTDPTTIYMPGDDDLDAGSVTLYYNPVDPDVCVESNDPLEITFVYAPVVNVPDDIEVCSDDSITIHINVSGDYTDIIWSTIGDGILLIYNDTEVNYTPGPQDIADQYTVVSVTVVSEYPECGQTTYNLPIDVVLCSCPELETMPPASALCAENETFDLSTLLIEGGSGMWEITGTPPGSNPAILSGDLFITNNSDPGAYVVTYKLDFPEPGCPNASSETIIVSESLMPDAGANIANCGPSMVFVSGTIVPFEPAETWWETLGDGMFVSPASLATSYIPGAMDSLMNEIKIVLHLFDSICGNKTDTTSIFFPQPPLANFIADTIEICNEEANGSILNFGLLIISGDTTGLWSNPTGVPIDFSDPDSVNFNGMASGYYNFNYQTNSATFPCQETNYTIVIHVDDCACPMLEVQPLPEGICNSLMSLNLGAFVMAGAPGTWQVISTPGGSNPATLNGAVMQTLGADPGNYLLRFTFDAAPLTGCPDSAEITIQIVAAGSVSISGDSSGCGLNTISLTAMTAGSATDILWTTSGSGTFTDDTLLNTNYLPSVNDVNSATVTLYATGSDTSGVCSQNVDSVIIFISHPPSTSWSGLSTSVCNNPASGTIVNFSSFITGGDGTGIWMDIDMALVDLDDPSNVDFDGVAPGVYNFSYTTQTAVPPCVDSTYFFEVTVEDCDCPALLLQDTIDFVCNTSEIPLSAFIIDVAPGAWLISSGPAGGSWPVISDTSIIFDNSSAGDYVITYQLTDSVPGCPASQNISLTVEPDPVLSFGAPDCDLVTMLYSVPVSIQDGTFTTDTGYITQVNPGNYLVDSIPSGHTLIVNAVNGNGNCEEQFLFNGPQCGCTLQTEDISDTIFLCPGDTFVLIPFTTGAQGLAFFTWISDVTLMQPTLPLYEEKTWIWIVRDMAGCEVRDTFSVDLHELINVDADAIPPTCDGLNNGAIIINDIDGGLPPYTVLFDEAPFLSDQIWPDTINNVGTGHHTITVSNMDGCETEVEMIVEDLSAGSIDLGPDQTVILGDSAFIDVQLQVADIISFQWEPANLNTIEPFWFVPEGSVLLSLTVMDSLGCMYEDSVLITVRIEQNFFIPNIISPNGDQINDVLEIFTNTNQNSIRSMEIFDRWGGLLYRQDDSPPFRWNGVTDGKTAQPGVYVVKVIWEDEEGNAHIIVSDVTLIR